MRVLGGIVAERRDGWDVCSYMRTPENGRQAFLARSKCAATEEVDIPARVVGHGLLTRGAWRVLLYIISVLDHFRRLYARACVLDNTHISRSVCRDGERCLGWMTTSWHQCNRTTPSMTIFNLEAFAHVSLRCCHRS